MITPKMYLEQNNFIIDKDKLTISPRDNLIIVCLTSDTCEMCKKSLLNIPEINSHFPQVNFAIISVNDNPNLLETTFKKLGLVITHVPTFILFKLGIFDRFLNISLTIKDIQNELKDELSVNIKPKPLLNNYR